MIKTGKKLLQTVEWHSAFHVRQKPQWRLSFRIQEGRQPQAVRAVETLWIFHILKMFPLSRWPTSPEQLRVTMFMVIYHRQTSPVIHRHFSST